MKRLPAIVSDLSTIPGRMRDAYEMSDDGRWYLQVDPVDGLELGKVAGVKADADRLFEALSARIRQTVVSDALKRANADATLMAPHLEAHIEIDRQTFAVRVTGSDGRFTTFDALLADLKARPGFAAAFDDAKTGSSPDRSSPNLNLTDRMAALKRQRDDDAKKAVSKAPKPVIDPRSPGYSMTEAMRWARGNPDRIVELQRAAAGR